MHCFVTVQGQGLAWLLCHTQQQRGLAVSPKSVKLVVLSIRIGTSLMRLSSHGFSKRKGHSSLALGATTILYIKAYGEFSVVRHDKTPSVI